MNLFPFVPLSSLRDGTNRDLLLNLALKKAEGETERERKGGVRRDTEIGGGGTKNTGYKERGEEGEKQEKSREPCERSKKQSENGGTLENAACACGGN